MSKKVVIWQRLHDLGPLYSACHYKDCKSIPHCFHPCKIQYDVYTYWHLVTTDHGDYQSNTLKNKSSSNNLSVNSCKDKYFSYSEEHLKTFLFFYFFFINDEETLTYIKSLHWTKVVFSGNRSFGLIKCSSHLENSGSFKNWSLKGSLGNQKWFFQWHRCENPSFWPFISKSAWMLKGLHGTI